MPGVHHAACAACLAISHGWGIYIDDGAPSTFALVQTSRRLSTCCALGRLCSGAVAALTRLGFFSSSTPLAVTRPSRTPALARGRGCRCSSSVTSEALIGHSAQFAPCGAVAGPGRAPGLAQHRCAHKEFQLLIHICYFPALFSKYSTRMCDSYMLLNTTVCMHVIQCQKWRVFVARIAWPPAVHSGGNFCSLQRRHIRFRLINA